MVTWDLPLTLADSDSTELIPRAGREHVVVASARHRVSDRPVTPANRQPRPSARNLDLHWGHRPRARAVFDGLRQRAKKLIADAASEEDPALVEAILRELDTEVGLSTTVRPPRPYQQWFGGELMARLGLPASEKRLLMVIPMAMVLVAFDSSPAEIEVERRRDALKPAMKALTQSMAALAAANRPPNDEEFHKLPTLEKLDKLSDGGFQAFASLFPLVEESRLALQKALAKLEELAAQFDEHIRCTIDQRLKVLLSAQVPTKDISAYLIELGYPEKQANEKSLTTRAHRLRERGFTQPIAPTARNRIRPKTGKADKK
jgi:hypothetical protein